MKIQKTLLWTLIFISFYITSIQSAFCPWPRGSYVNYAHPTWEPKCSFGGPDFTCATWDGVEQECNGYMPAGDNCASGQYRDYDDCLCYNCPTGKGSICTLDRPCCDGVRSCPCNAGSRKGSYPTVKYEPQTCTPCGGNSYSPADSATCYCNPGYTGPDNGACGACGPGKYKEGSGSAACTECGAGKFSLSTGATVSSTCGACGAGTASSAGAGSC